MTWMIWDGVQTIWKHWDYPHWLIVREAHAQQSSAFGILNTIRPDHHWIKLAFTVSYKNNSYWGSGTRMYSWPRGGEPTFTESSFRKRAEPWTSHTNTNTHTHAHTKTNKHTLFNISVDTTGPHRITDIRIIDLTKSFWITKSKFTYAHTPGCTHTHIHSTKVSYTSC